MQARCGPEIRKHDRTISDEKKNSAQPDHTKNQDHKKNMQHHATILGPQTIKHTKWGPSRCINHPKTSYLRPVHTKVSPSRLLKLSIYIGVLKLEAWCGPKDLIPGGGLAPLLRPCGRIMCANPCGRAGLSEALTAQNHMKTPYLSLCADDL